MNLTYLLGADGASTLQSQIGSSLASSSESLVPSSYAEVVEGYKAIYNVTLNTILPNDVGVVEVLLSLTGAGNVVVQAALQHPFRQVRLSGHHNRCADTLSVKSRQGLY